jgi:hypothetical protein
MSSHNSAISSRTDFNSVRVLSSQSPYIATVVGRSGCTHSLIHSDASFDNPYTIVLPKHGVVSVSQSPIFFAYCIFGFTCRLFSRISELTTAMLYVLPIRNCIICAWWMDTVAHRVYITSQILSPQYLEFKYHYGVDLPK